MIDMLRANCSVIVRSSPPPVSGSTVPVRPPLTIPVLSRMVPVPRSAPQKITSVPCCRTPASYNSGASGAPAQRAVPMAPMKTGPRVAGALQGEIHLATGAGFKISERQGLGTGHLARDADTPCGLIETLGYAVVVDKEKVVGRGQPGVERFPFNSLTTLGLGLGPGWSSHGMTCPPDWPKACAGPATRSTVSPASAAAPPFNKVRREMS